MGDDDPVREEPRREDVEGTVNGVAVRASGQPRCGAAVDGVVD